MNNEYLKRLLNDVGMSTFVKYYYEFQQGDRQKAIASISEPFTDKSKGTRTSKAIKIFNEGLNLQILQIIIESSRVDNITRLRAKDIHNSLKK